MKKTSLFLLLTILVLLLAGCGEQESDGSLATQQSESAPAAQQPESAPTAQQPDSQPTPQKTGSLKLEYATGFSVEYYDDHTHVTVGDTELDVKKPYDNIYMASSSVMDLFLHEDALSAVKMTSTKIEDWTIPEVSEAMEDGSIKYVGKYSAPDYELLLDEGCDLVIENTMIYHSPKVREQLMALGLPVIVENSSYEEHVLGRMEWVKLYGVLTGHEAEAEAFFEDAKKRLAAVGQAKRTDKKVAFFYVTSSGYVSTRKPGDYISELIDMAGGEYVLADVLVEDDNNLSSMNMDVESFVAAARDCDVIIYNSTVSGAPESVEELVALAPFLKDFQAVGTGEVWCTGANMFQMTGSLPEVAEELVTVIAGEEDDGLSFFKKLR